ILDNLKVHHGKLVANWLLDKKEKIEIFYLPPYAPEYNPDEYLNGNLKRVIAAKESAHTLIQMESNTRSFMKKNASQQGPCKIFF
ncbi:MAG: transposase, partial [Candidatus Adiutrix sp.]